MMKNMILKNGLLTIENRLYRVSQNSRIREFRIQSVVGKDPVELEKYIEKKIRSS
jgi:hypothetical protein